MKVNQKVRRFYALIVHQKKQKIVSQPNKHKETWKVLKNQHIFMELQGSILKQDIKLSYLDYSSK